ncbi:DUF4097 family beta strand repeat-containing protein [Niallia sp. BSM11]|uniref:DUF4097 family beta strand repeat-containing protein n=1 Tax=Niallia sp. BSM11 TaxID=3391576 RepID=UPI0039853163
MNKRKLLWAGAVLLVIGLIGSLATYKQSAEKFDLNERKVIESNNFEHVEISADNAAIEIHPIQESSAYVQLSGTKRGNRELNYSAEVESNKLKVILKEKGHQLIPMSLFGDSELSLDLYLPEKQYASMIADIKNGRIKMTDLSSREVVLHTANGRLELANITAETVKADSSNGRIQLDNVSGEIDGKTINGRIELNASALNQDIQLQTNNGEISVTAEKEPENANISAETDNGDIEIFKQANSNVIFGDGEYKIRLKTNNGDIEVN